MAIINQEFPQKAMVEKNRHMVMRTSIVVALITLVSYFPAFKAQFTNWDDDHYVVYNKTIRSLSVMNLQNHFKSYVMGNYHPLTMISYTIDYAIANSNPRTYHLHSLFLHVLTTVAAVWLLFLLSGRWQIAGMGGILFGVHPMHVESVAWISERKDVLYGLWFILSLISYIFYLKRNTYRHTFYCIALFSFLISLFAKGQAITLPGILILIDYWMNRNLFEKKIILEKLPFITLSLVFGLIALDAQNSAQAIPDVIPYTTQQRMLFPFYGLFFYLAKAFLPIGLSHYYPYPDVNNATLPVVYPFSCIIVIILIVLSYWSCKKTRDIVFGMLFFLFSLIPVLQVMPVGKAITADRYTYISYLGIFFIVARFVDMKFIKPLPNLSNKSFKVYFFIGLIIILLTFTCFHRVKVWENSETLWTDFVSKYPELTIGYNSRAHYYAVELGNYDLAIKDYSTAIKIDPTYGEAYKNRALTYELSEKYNLALKDLDLLIFNVPGERSLYKHRGRIYEKKGQPKLAQKNYDKAMSIKTN